jgi:hypothetical protein
MLEIQKRNKLILQKKIDDYNEKQKLLEERQKEIEIENKIKQKEEQIKRELKEQKIKNTFIRNEELLENKKEKILDNIKKKEENTILVKKKKELFHQRIEKENIEKELEKESKIKQIAQLQENKREDIRKWIKEKNDKIIEFKRQKEIINQNKRILVDEIARKKEEYSSRFQQIFHKKNIDENTLKNIQDMFPNNKEISNLIDEFNELTINTNDKNDIKKKRIQSTKYEKRDKFKISNFSINDNYYDDNYNNNWDKNIRHKNLQIVKDNIYEKYNLVPLPNKRFNKDSYENNNIYNKSYSNQKNENYNILFPNNNDNKELTYEKNNKINNYKNIMNKELLEILRNEKQKDELRQRQLEELDYNDPQRIILEKKYGEEKAKSNSMISQKKSEIEQKISEYELKIKKEY